MLQYKTDAQTGLVTGWLLTIGGIIGIVLPVLPGWPFLLLGLSTLSKRYGWARRVMAGLHAHFSSFSRHLERLKKGRNTSMLPLAIQHSDDVTTVWVTTIWCKGRIVLGDDLHRLKVATLSQSTFDVMLDLSSVNVIDAAGLGALVDLHKRFQCAGRKMELMDPTRFVSHVFRITRLDTVLHIVRSADRGGRPVLGLFSEGNCDRIEY
jgi:anti-anti-sigma factor